MHDINYAATAVKPHELSSLTTLEDIFAYPIRRNLGLVSRKPEATFEALSVQVGFVAENLAY